jgi:hypothetical protein
MFWEIIHIASETLYQRPNNLQSTGPASPGRFIRANSLVTRFLLTIIAAWMSIACIVIVLELIDTLPIWALIAVVALPFMSLFVVSVLWWSPTVAARFVIPESFLLLGLSGSIVASQLFVTYRTAEAGLAVIFLLPSAMLYLLLAIKGRKAIYLADWARQQEVRNNAVRR